MNDDRLHEDYLWDGSGEPDPDIARLEEVLRPVRHRGLPPVWPARTVRRHPVNVAIPILSVAASLTLVAAAAWFDFSIRRAGWTLEPLAGRPAIEGQSDPSARLAVGQWLTTDAESRARLGIGEIGQVDVEPNSRLRLLEARAGEHRMSLERGRILAQIWAPPGLFFVNTPAAVAVDLGCAYTLDVDDHGWGVVRVIHGWVGFEYAGRESFIPQEAICTTRPGYGPGTPHYADAPEGIEDALATLDFTAPGDGRRDAALAVILDRSRPRDAVSLWHLLTRGTAAERARVYDRMATLAPPPPEATREAILRGDRKALDAWWNALGLASADWWRMWKTPWRR